MLLEMSIVMALINDTHNPAATVEQHCLIENAIYESIGEGQRGMQLVTEVAINRMDAGYNGVTDFCHTIYQPYQFSWTLINEDNRLPYSEDDYLDAAQVVLSVLYGEVDRILPENVYHYLNVRHATDMSWYDPSKVVHRHRNHQFLASVR